MFGLYPVPFNLSAKIALNIKYIFISKENTSKVISV